MGDHTRVVAPYHEDGGFNWALHGLDLTGGRKIQRTRLLAEQDPKLQQVVSYVDRFANAAFDSMLQRLKTLILQLLPQLSLNNLGDSLKLLTDITSLESENQ